MQVGLDWGTTNTSATLFDRGRIRLLDLDPRNDPASVLRTAMFISREGAITLGRAAIDSYTTSNVGREIEYKLVYIGTTEQTYAEVGTIKQDLFTTVDANMPGRLFLSIKLGLADPGFTGTDVFGTRWSVEELVALTLRHIAARVEELSGTAITEIVIGKPVHYADDDRGNLLALQRMRDAARLAGLRNVRFLAEPTAASLVYSRRSAQPQHLLIFDFGGGTLDVTISRLDPGGARTILATDGVPVGGDLLDQRIVMHKLHPHFGAGAELGPRRLPLPAFLLDHLSGWQSIIDLHTPHTLELIDDAIQHGNRPRELRALRSLVRENYGLPLYEMVERAKRQLSDEEHATLRMHVADIHFAEPLERWDFERIIGPDMRTIRACLDRALDAAGLAATDIDVVLRTGGSSRIPRVVRMLSDLFGAHTLTDGGEGIFTSVASGLGRVFADQRTMRQLSLAGHLIEG